MKKIYLVLSILVITILSSCSAAKDNTLTLTGNIEGNITNISSEVSSKVVDIKKDEGNSIKKGECIYLLDDSIYEIQKEQSENQINALEAQLKTIKDQNGNNSIKIAQYNLKAAEKSKDVLDKQIEDLNNNNNALNVNPALKAINDKTNQETLLKLKLQREQTQSQIDALKLQLKSVKEDSGNNIKAAEYNLKAAKSSLKLINENIKRCRVVSPQNGVIDTINFKKGELVQQGAQLFSINDTNSLYLKIYVPERYLSKIKLGSSIVVYIPSLSDKSITGSIVKIDSTGQYTPTDVQTVDEKSNVVYGVKIKLKGNDELKPGMIGEVKIK